MEENTALQIFSYESDEMRTVVDEKGNPWFVVNDVCNILEIANIGNAIARLDRDGIRQTDVTDSSGRTQMMAIANEPNLYRLIFRSDKPGAKAFQDWVYEEVLPAIRKTGSYSLNQEPPLQGSLVAVLEDPKRLAQLIHYLQGVETTLYPAHRLSRRCDEPPAPSKVVKEMLGALDQSATPLYPRQLAALLGIPGNTMRKRLFDMKHRGEVKDTGEGYIPLIPQSEPE